MKKPTKRQEKQINDAAGYILAWFTVPNPHFGGITPLAMLEAGRGHKVAELVREAMVNTPSDS